MPRSAVNPSRTPAAPHLRYHAARVAIAQCAPRCLKPKVCSLLTRGGQLLLRAESGRPIAGSLLRDLQERAGLGMICESPTSLSRGQRLLQRVARARKNGQIV